MNVEHVMFVFLASSHTSAPVARCMDENSHVVQKGEVPQYDGTRCVFDKGFGGNGRKG